MTFIICDLEPFVSQVTPQSRSLEHAASAAELFQNQIALYLRRMREAICTDIQNAGGGVDHFIQLLDAPNSYLGQANKVVAVNGAANALEFISLVAGITKFTQLSDVPGSYIGSSLRGVRVNAAETALEFYLRTLIGLADFPANYTSQALKALRVNAAANAVEFFVQSLLLLSDFPAAFTGAALKYLRVNAGETAVEFATFPSLVTAFTQLSDVPPSYATFAGSLVQVNAAESGLEFVSSPAKQGLSRGQLIAPGNSGSGGAPVVTAIGCGLVTPVGTWSFPVPASTNLKTSKLWMRGTTTAANNNAVQMNGRVSFWRGNAAGLGGFLLNSEFSVNSTATSNTCFIGLQPTITAIAPTQEASAFIDMVGVGYDGSDSNLQVYTNDGSGTASKTDLGSNFPARTTTAVYQVIISAFANASSITVTVNRLDSAFTSTTTLSSNLPTSTVFLAQTAWMSNRASGGVAAVFDVARIYAEPLA